MACQLFRLRLCFLWTVDGEVDVHDCRVVVSGFADECRVADIVKSAKAPPCLGLGFRDPNQAIQHRHDRDLDASKSGFHSRLPHTFFLVFDLPFAGLGDLAHAVGLFALWDLRSGSVITPSAVRQHPTLRYYS